MLLLVRLDGSEHDCQRGQERWDQMYSFQGRWNNVCVVWQQVISQQSVEQREQRYILLVETIEWIC